MMKKFYFIASITTANSGGKFFAPKINVNVPEEDITTADFKLRYEDSLYVVGDTREEALEKAELILSNLNKLLIQFKNQNRELLMEPN